MPVTDAGYWDPVELTPDARKMLRVYLNDHRAGAAGGLALARRCLRNNDGSPLGETLRQEITEIEEDATTLERIIDRLGVAENLPKQLLAIAAERVGRLKLNTQLTGYSPLSRLLELDALLAGIDAKRSLWCALRASAASDVLSEFDLRALAERATEQRRRLQPHARDAASSAFGRSTGGGLTIQEEVRSADQSPDSPA